MWLTPSDPSSKDTCYSFWTPILRGWKLFDALFWKIRKGVRKRGGHPSPGRRCWFCGLSLQPRVTHDMLFDRHLHLGRDIWGRVADLHSRLQEAQGTGVLQLVCHVASGAGTLEGL